MGHPDTLAAVHRGLDARKDDEEAEVELHLHEAEAFVKALQLAIDVFAGRVRA